MQRFEYHAEVNRGSINMRSLGSDLNKMGADGWRLSQAFEQDGNTILIYERPLAAS